MSESVPKFKLSVGTWILIIGSVGSILITSLSFHNNAQATFIEHEKRIMRLELRDEEVRREFAINRELLIRIDERTVEIKRKQDQFSPK